MVYVFLANGFEETEAIVPIDLMRRAGIDVRTVAVGESLTVTGSHGIPVTADIFVSDVDVGAAEAVVLPGGQPGTDNLFASDEVKSIVTAAYERGAVTAAICAAPYILGRLGLLRGHNAVCYPGYEGELDGAELCQNGVTVATSGNIITAKAAGYALDFGEALITAICGGQKSADVISAVCP